MARSIDASVLAELTSGNFAPFLLVAFFFDSGRLNFWNGVTTIAFSSSGDDLLDGETFLGLGTLGTVGEIPETVETRANGVQFSMSGLDPVIASIALNEPYMQRDVRVWLGTINSQTDVVIGVPLRLWKGKIDGMSFRKEGRTTTVTIRAENVLVALDRPNERRWTDEDQKLVDPTDRGFEFVTDIQDKQVVWGSF